MAYLFLGVEGTSYFNYGSHSDPYENISFFDNKKDVSMLGILLLRDFSRQLLPAYLQTFLNIHICFGIHENLLTTSYQVLLPKKFYMWLVDQGRPVDFAISVALCNTS